MFTGLCHHGGSRIRDGEVHESPGQIPVQTHYLERPCIPLGFKGGLISDGRPEAGGAASPWPLPRRSRARSPPAATPGMEADRKRVQTGQGGTTEPACRGRAEAARAPCTRGCRGPPGEAPPPLPSSQFSRNGYWPQRKFQSAVRKPLLGSRLSTLPQITGLLQRGMVSEQPQMTEPRLDARRARHQPRAPFRGGVSAHVARTP